ncbi:MAG: hypothetical protein L3J08_09110 [Flavobacteriaceae bacterium]|nr:hypothetical protein [Flavobacteriaceae bacterium]
MTFNSNETKTLLEAIRQYRGREGNFYSTDPIVDIIGKLSNSEKNEFKNSELKNIITVINENITFLKNYTYQGLSEEQSKINKKNIIEPLEKIKVRAQNKL